MKGSRDSTQNNREEKEIDKQRTGQRLLNHPPKDDLLIVRGKSRKGTKAYVKCARLQLKFIKGVQGKCTLEKSLKPL